MTVCNQKIEEAIEQELSAALEKHGQYQYHSDAERYAVMLEELDETREELIAAQMQLELMWRQVKLNHGKQADEFAARVGYAAEKLAREACQLAAAARKAVTRET